MGKDQERQRAKYYYVEKGCTAKETAARVGVTEATVGAWVAKGGWKELREAMATTTKARVHNLEQVLSQLAEQRLDTSRELRECEALGDTKKADELRRALARIDDGAGKWSKAIAQAKKDGRVSLSVHLEIMELLFAAMRDYDEQLFLRSVDFQAHYIEQISTKE